MAEIGIYEPKPVDVLEESIGSDHSYYGGYPAKPDPEEHETRTGSFHLQKDDIPEAIVTEGEIAQRSGQLRKQLAARNNENGHRVDVVAVPKNRIAALQQQNIREYIRRSPDKKENKEIAPVAPTDPWGNNFEYKFARRDRRESREEEDESASLGIDKHSTHESFGSGLFDTVDESTDNSPGSGVGAWLNGSTIISERVADKEASGGFTYRLAQNKPIVVPPPSGGAQPYEEISKSISDNDFNWGLADADTSKSEDKGRPRESGRDQDKKLTSLSDIPLLGTFFLSKASQSAPAPPPQWQDMGTVVSTPSVPVSGIGGDVITGKKKDSTSFSGDLGDEWEIINGESSKSMEQPALAHDEPLVSHSQKPTHPQNANKISGASKLYIPDLMAIDRTIDPDDIEELAPPTDFSPAPGAFDAVALVKSPVIMKGIFASRDPGARSNALKAGGGGGSTEGPVIRSLRWMKEKQSENGSWGNDVGDTSLALLSYLSHGETPASKEFGKTTEKALKSLIDKQDANGKFSDDPVEHAKATHALNEAYGMTKIPVIAEAAERATAALLSDQSKTREPSLWEAQALKSAKLSGMKVDKLDEAMKVAAAKLALSDKPTSAYGMQLLGYYDHPETKRKLTVLKDVKFDSSNKDTIEDMYFITQAKFNEGGQAWNKWNRDFAPKLVKNQRVVKGGASDGKDIGSWSSDTDGNGADDVNTTALAALMSSVYYRYLPTFRKTEKTGKEANEELDDIVIEIASARRIEEEEPQQNVFKAYGVNPFHSAKKTPFSTFAIDVDTASYTLARNYMMRGLLPPAESVRTEEFVNFFDYDYAAPTRKTFEIHSECAPTPFGRGLHLLKIGVKGKVIGRDEQKQAILTFVIDTSGSMNTPDRMELVKKSLTMLVDKLSPEDRVAIVTFGSNARLILEHTPAAQKTRILQAINNLQTTGSTNLEEGMKVAYQVAVRAFKGGASNRVLILSDGAANLGTAAAADILKEVETQRKQGIYCSVFGFGMGTYNDEMLETLANKGDGTYLFIDSADEAKRVFVNDLSATLNTIATDVKIQVEFDPNRVKRYRQIGYENRQLKKEQFRDDTVDAGEVGSGQSVTALYEVELNEKSRAPIGMIRVRYRRTDNSKVEEIERAVPSDTIYRSFEKATGRFQLAAAIAEFAEILRGSPHAPEKNYAKTSSILSAVGLDLDDRVKEAARMAAKAQSMPRGARE